MLITDSPKFFKVTIARQSLISSLDLKKMIHFMDFLAITMELVEHRFEDHPALTEFNCGSEDDIDLEMFELLV